MVEPIQSAAPVETWHVYLFVSGDRPERFHGAASWRAADAVVRLERVV